MAAPGSSQQTGAVSIIGTGDFGCSLAKRLLLNGFQVAIGSRNPANRNLREIDPILADAHVLKIPECIAFSDVIVVAIHPDAHESLSKYGNLLEGKILVDVSNTDTEKKTSNAHALAALVPGARIVKAFNTVSAYALASQADEYKPVYVCGDDITARKAVMGLASELGFSPINSGALTQALNLEQKNRELFPGWGWPSIVLLIVFLVWMAYSLVRYYVLRATPYTWERLPINVINKALGCTSLTLLACVSLPGCIAAFTQLANGTKHKRFPKGLDRWLKMRKQLGLYALLCACLHMMMSLALLSPAYYSKFYLAKSATIPLNRTEDTVINISSRLNWKGETVILFGFLAVFTMAILGLTSIPSITSRLNWREWACVQSWLGLACFVFAVSHVTIKGGPGWAKSSAASIFQSLAFLALLLPWFTLALRLVLLLPCVYSRVSRIRRGWERAPGGKKDPEAANGIALLEYTEK